MGWPMPCAQPPLHMLGAIDLVFGARGNCAGLLGDGWSAQEDGYCWAVGPHSMVSLPTPAGTPGAYRLEIELAPFTAGAALPGQRLVGSINGWRFTAPLLETLSVLEIVVPAGVVDGAIDMMLEVPDAARPCDVLGGDDNRNLGFSFRRMRLETMADAPVPTMFGPAAEAPGPLDDTELMLRFESLGENCEFGLVQRHAGAEPLGLLRFASAPLPYLLSALAAGFAGMGAPGRVTVRLGGDGQEWMVHDDVYGLLYHTGARAGTDPARIAARETQRLRFLIDKLLSDIGAGDKIFVFHPGKAVHRRAADLLGTAMAQFGAAPLLWVEPATADFPCGTVQRLSETMFIGHLGHFAPADNAHDFDYAAWRLLCRTCLVARGGG